MTIAIDDNKIRIQPYRGGRAKCPRCLEPVIAKCGEIYTWHWAHKADKNCDPWQEHETQWHRNWKNKFPIELQEVVIVDDWGEKHFADVRTQAGVVIEFQNSSISKETIRTREEFYEDMIWVINAEPFKENFRLASVVKRKLREIQTAKSDLYVPLEVELKNQLNDLVQAIATKQEQIDPLFTELRKKQERIDVLSRYKNGLSGFATEVVESWYNDTYLGYDKTELTTTINKLYKDRIKSLSSEKKEAKSRLERLEGQAIQIARLESITLEGTNFRIVPWQWVNEKNYQQARFFDAREKDSLFVSSKKFTNDLEYSRIRYHSNKYVACLDISTVQQAIETSISSLQKDMQALEEFIPSVFDAICESIRGRIETLIEQHNERVAELTERWENLIKERSDIEFKKGLVEMKIASDVPKAKKEALRELDDEKFSVMRNDKGSYYFRWTHERKSWLAAEMPLYFDIGETYLLRKISDNLLCKVEIADFLSLHNDLSQRTAIDSHH